MNEFDYDLENTEQIGVGACRGGRAGCRDVWLDELPAARAYANVSATCGWVVAAVCGVAHTHTQLLGWRMCLCLASWGSAQVVSCIPYYCWWTVPSSAALARARHSCVASHVLACVLACSTLLSSVTLVPAACVLLVHVPLFSMPCHAVVAKPLLLDVSWLYYYLHCPQQHPCSCRKPTLCCVRLLPAASQPLCCGGPRCPCSAPCFLVLLHGLVPNVLGLSSSCCLFVGVVLLAHVC